MGKTDKLIRVLVAAVIGMLYFTNQIEGTVAYILLALAGIFLLTCVFSFCLLYLPFGISTKKKN